uniref:DUF2240 family protein n=1 Tax=Strongyloides venezuelensis TaxID=75913 RepID=A0A0K0F5V5_STRVS
MVYNYRDEITLKEIGEALGCKDCEIKGSMQLFVEIELLCISSGNDSYADDNIVLTLNREFSSRGSTFDLSNSTNRLKHFKESINASYIAKYDRKCFLESLIVLVMRDRGILRDGVMVFEVVNQLEDLSILRNEKLKNV